MAVSVMKKRGAQAVDHFLRVRLRGVRFEGIVLAVQHVGHAGESHLHHQGRGDAVARAHAGKVERLLDVLDVPLPAPDAGNLLRGVREDIAHALFVQPRQ